MQGRPAVLEPQAIVEIIAPAADFACGIEIEHPNAREFETPTVAVEIPAVEALGNNRIAATEAGAQFPVHPARELHDACDNYAYVALADHWRERLVNVDDVVR